MAKNITVEFLQDPMTHMDLAVTVPTVDTVNLIPASGTAVLVGNIPGVASTNVDPSTGLTPVVTSCIAELPVDGKIAGGGNGAINAGTVLYMQTTGHIDANSSGGGAVKFGTSFGNGLNTGNNTGVDTRTGQLVASGAAATVIRVWVGKIN